MKSIIMEGTVEKAPCEHCQALIEATFAYGPLKLENEIVVDDVMRATCNRCSSVVALAPQSAHRLGAAIRNQPRKRTTLRISRELEDYVALRLSQNGADGSHFELFFRALLVACKGREEVIGLQLQQVKDSVLQSSLSVIANMTLTPNLQEVLERLQTTSGIQTSDLIRRLIVLSEDSKSGVDVTSELRTLTYAYA